MNLPGDVIFTIVKNGTVARMDPLNQVLTLLEILLGYARASSSKPWLFFTHSTRSFRLAIRSANFTTSAS